MDRKNVRLKFGFRWIGLSVILLSFTSHVFGQEARLEPKKEEQQFRVFELRDADANSVLQAAQQLFPDASRPSFQSVTGRGNRIIVRGSSQQVEQFATLIELIDQKAIVQEEPADLQIYDLRYVEVDQATDILATLLQSEKSTRLSAEPRLNRMIVYGTDAVHTRVRKVLDQIDVPTQSSSSSVMKIESDSRGSVPAQELMFNTAKEYGVKLELMPQLGVAVVRGGKPAVEAFRDEVSSVMEAAAVASRTATISAPSENLLVRVMWLAALDEGSELPEGLEPIANRAATFGMNDLKLMGQLVGAASVNQDRAQEFEMQGEMKSGMRLSAAGSIGLSASSSKRITASVIIEVGNGNEINPVAQLSLNLPIGKPMMIASAPINGTASVFVIEALPSE